MSPILEEILSNVPEGDITKVLIGMHWTAVVVETEGGQRCGLASTLSRTHNHHGQPNVPHAGELDNLSGTALAFLAGSDEPTLASVGVAAINALLPRNPAVWDNLNAEEVLARNGRGKKVAIIGHFPFAARLRSHVDELIVLEQRPRPGDLPSTEAAEILPQADVIAITGTTLINHTLEELLALCSKQALIILLGPSTPLSPVLFDHGVDILCGSVVKSIDPVLMAVGQGGDFHQVRLAGVRTVTMVRPGYN